MSEEQNNAPKWELSDLGRDQEKSVNGVEVPVPGYEGLTARIAAYSRSAHLEWLKRFDEDERKKRGWDDEDAERAFFGGYLLLDIGPLHDAEGNPEEWTEERGMEVFTRKADVVDRRTGKTVSRYVYDHLYAWVWRTAYDEHLFVEEAAKN